MHSGPFRREGVLSLASSRQLCSIEHKDREAGRGGEWVREENVFNQIYYKAIILQLHLMKYCFLHPFVDQNISLFYSNVCKQGKCKQTPYSPKTWLQLYIWYHRWWVLATIALSMNLRAVTFLQPHPLAKQGVVACFVMVSIKDSSFNILWNFVWYSVCLSLQFSCLIKWCRSVFVGRIVRERSRESGGHCGSMANVVRSDSLFQCPLIILICARHVNAQILSVPIRYLIEHN